MADISDPIQGYAQTAGDEIQSLGVKTLIWVN